MNNFHWGSCSALLTSFGAFASASSNNIDAAAKHAHADPYVVFADSKHKAEFLEQLEYAEVSFTCLASRHIESAIAFAESRCRLDTLTWSEFNTVVRRVRDAIEVELQGHLFFRYPRDKGKKLSAFPDDWAFIATAFPAVHADALCATDCYGMEQNTASVFHSMRVAEHGLRAIASERRIRLPKNKPVEWGNWMEIIKELDNAIKEVAGAKAGAAKDRALAFYSGARSDLNGFKDEYRNSVMHVRDRYDEHQALRALTNVHHFMGRLSEKLNHKKKRIRWGL